MMRDYLTLLQQNLFYSEGQLDASRLTLAASLFVLVLIAIFMRFQRFAEDKDRDWRDSLQRQGQASAKRADQPWLN